MKHELQQYMVAESFLVRALKAYGCCSNSANANAEGNSASDASNS
jgi:hypothetical protein